MDTSESFMNALYGLGWGMSLIFSLPKPVTIFPSLETDTGSCAPASMDTGRMKMAPSGKQSTGVVMLSAGKDGTCAVETSSSGTFSGAATVVCEEYSETCCATDKTTAKSENDSTRKHLHATIVPPLAQPERDPRRDIGAVAIRNPDFVVLGKFDNTRSGSRVLHFRSQT